MLAYLEPTQDHKVDRPKLQSLRNLKGKSKEVKQNLLSEFHKHQFWSRRKIDELAKQHGLKYNQVYKWHWDMRLKLREQVQKQLVNELKGSEKLAGGAALALNTKSLRLFDV